ncbi:MAG: hypothetical protein KF681_04045 [Bdellovibrionaceae bacterium]|nr:hypothetical protein [Pseudobdellovibrionaceae bacterium]
MGVTSLPSTQALTPGADLWVIGTSTESPWALKLDWALNFQVLRAATHQRPELARDLNEVLNETGLERVVAPVTKRDLLIAADMNLPCRWVLSLDTWDLAALKKTAEGLGHPALRIFLPRAIDSEKFVRQWTEAMGERDFQLVVE